MLQFDTFIERFRYLSLGGVPFEQTFGSERYINQNFYTSSQWRRIRIHVIARDLGNDLGVEGFEIPEGAIVHHMNPMEARDIVRGKSDILDPEYLITTTHQTHNAIHYGDERHLPRPFVDRFPGDTKFW